MSRTALLFGTLLGIVQLLGTLLVYAFGLHSSPDTLAAAARFEDISAFVAIMAAMCFGLHSTRVKLLQAKQAFDFRIGAKATLGISAVGTLLTVIGQYIYFTVINPDLAGHLRTSLFSKVQLTPEQAEAYAWQVDFATSASFHVLKHGLTLFFFSLMVGLLYSLLFRARPASRLPASAG